MVTSKFEENYMSRFEMTKVKCTLKYKDEHNNDKESTNVIELIHHSRDIKKGFFSHLLGKVPIKNNRDGFQVDLSFVKNQRQDMEAQRILM